MNRGDKTKRKVWKDINEVVKVSIVPKKLKWYEREMLVVPKGEKSKWLGFFFILLQSSSKYIKEVLRWVN